jgi:hypothetical protein
MFHEDSEISNDDPTVTVIGDGFDETTTKISTMDGIGILHRAQSVVIATVMHPVFVYRMSGGIQRQGGRRAKDLVGEGQEIVLGMLQHHAFQEVAAQKMMDSLVSMSGSGRRSSCGWIGIGRPELRKVASPETRNTIL